MENAALDQILDTLLKLDIWQVVKGVFLFAILLYLVFAIVVVRQVNLMLSTLEVELESLIKAIAWIHLFLVIGVLVFGIIYL